MQPLTHGLVDILQIFLVILRNNDRMHAIAVGRHGLFPKAANRQHPTPDRDLTGHGNITAHRRIGQRGNDRSRNGNAVAERMLLEALYKALDQLSESDCDLIRALYFEGKTLSEYGEEKGCAISTLSERRKRILRDLKKVLKNFAE